MALLWKVLIGLLLLLAVAAGSSTVTHRMLARQRLAAEEAVRKQLEEKETEVRQQGEIIAKAKADEAKAKAELARAQAESIRLLKERSTLIDRAREAGSARERIREEVASVPEAQVRQRIRAGLVRLRGSAPRPGG